MRAEHLVLLLCATAGAVPAGAQATATPDSAIAAAGRAAQRWFALLADRNYGASWEQASTYFRDHVSREQWRVNAERLDRQFQRVDHRQLVEARWLHDEPPLPPAEYVVLRWLTDLGQGRQVGERVIMTHEPDGAWRPATYDLFPNVEGLPLLAPDHRAPPVPPPPPPRNIVPPARGG